MNSDKIPANIFHCPHCNAETPAGDGIARCQSCGKEFEPMRMETVPQPPNEPARPAQPSPSSELGAAPDLAPGVELDGYRLEAEVGRGGMGIVYRALQKSLQRKVALKVLPRKLATDPHFIARFEREALALASLNHPNIVQVIDRGLSGEICYLVMEFVEGVSLRHLLHDSKLSPEQALEIVPQICAALEYAHGKGVVHRDIKPENILLTSDGQIKITDFGLARIVHGEKELGNRSLTHTNVLMGTPEYMAPEQREKAKTVDHRADIFSLGVIFYEMLTGELPIGRFPVPSKRVQVDVRLDEVILKSLEKEPDLRYQRASHLSKDVQGIASNYRSSAPTPSSNPEASTRANSVPAGFHIRLKNGREIQMKPKGIPATSTGQRPHAPVGFSSAPAETASEPTGEKTPSQLSSLAVIAFLFSLIPFLILLLALIWDIL